MDSAANPDPEAGRPGTGSGVARSRSWEVGQKSDTSSGASEALDEAGHELNRLAQISLVASAIDLQRAELPELLALASPQLDLQSGALIHLVEDGCARLRSLDERYGEVATVLFGAEPGLHGRPYASRLADAAEAWQEGMTPATFNRRHRNKVIRELARAVKGLRSDADSPAFRLWLERDPAFQPLPDDQDWPNLSFKRRRFHARAYIQGIDRRQSYTDWTYTDSLVRATDGLFRIYTKEDNARVEIQALSSNVDVVRPLGLDRRGYQTWLLQFAELPPFGDTFEWSVRKVYHRFDDIDAEPGWLALAVSQPQPIESGVFQLNYQDADRPPIEFCRFVTPKQTLPNLRGTEWSVVPVEGIAAGDFKDLEPGSSYGLMWSWHVGGIARRVKR